MTKIATIFAAALALAVLAEGAVAASPDQPQDVIIMTDFSSDNAAIDPQHAETTGKTVAALIEGLGLDFGDRVLLQGVGTAIPEGWNAKAYELSYKGAQPKDAPAFVATRIADLQHDILAPTGTADLVWGIERLPTDCAFRTSTLIVISNVIGAGTRDGDTRFSIEGVPGAPQAGCHRLIWVGVGQGGDYPKGIVRAAESVLIDLGKQIGFEDVSVAR